MSEPESEAEPIEDTAEVEVPTDPRLYTQLEVPAPFVDRFWVNGNGPIVRITFFEQCGVPTESKTRSAVLMTASDAFDLARVILSLQIAPDASTMAKEAEAQSFTPEGPTKVVSPI